LAYGILIAQNSNGQRNPQPLQTYNDRHRLPSKKTKFWAKAVYGRRKSLSTTGGFFAAFAARTRPAFFAPENHGQPSTARVKTATVSSLVYLFVIK
jgi:hypothetical protein